MPGPDSPTSVYHITWAETLGICCIFFWGCNLRCRICLLQKEVLDCHLPETRLRVYDPSHQNANPGRTLTYGEVLRHLDRLQICKVFLMGAEPLCEPFLPDLLKHLRQAKACSISLLTNGKATPPLDLVDEVVFSIKAVTPSLHRDYTGCGNREILRNFTMLGRLPRPRLTAETVFIPGYVDEQEVSRIAFFIASVNRGISFRIDAYLPVPGATWRAPTVDEMEDLCQKVRRILPETTFLHGRQGLEPLGYEVERIV